jgi:acetoin utilization deacetylase AcuC-like enzyme
MGIRPPDYQRFDEGLVKTVYSEKHALRNPNTELSGGELVRPFECPERAEIIKRAIERVGLGPIVGPANHPRERLSKLHDPDYLGFLETAWERWQAAGYAGEAIPSVWPARRMTERRAQRDRGAARPLCLRG